METNHDAEPGVLMDTTGLRPNGVLKFVEAHEGHSEYVTETGDTVLLQHGTGRVLYDSDDLDVRKVWSKYLTRYAEASFLDWLKVRVTDPDVVEEITFCADCSAPDHTDDTHYTHEGHGSVCEGCWDNYYACNDCEEFFTETTRVGDVVVCNRCLENNYSWCEPCDEYYPSTQGCYGDHDDDECGCEAPAQSFQVRNDGAPALSNDTYVKVALPAGVISDEGIGQIAVAIRAFATDMDYDTDDQVVARDHMFSLSYNLAALDPRWQTKEGNYTKRLSRYAYQKHDVKVPPALLSQVGNIASDHSRPVDFKVAVTRDLNQSAYDFANEESCWWGSYYSSRCRFKSNGGFGLRSFDDNEDVTGRAWVMPLRRTDQPLGKTHREEIPTGATCTDAACCPQSVPYDRSVSLVPTFETMAPSAFVVFNGYGALSEYAAARIVSHMAGWTYRKIEFKAGSSDNFYINGFIGYLVAPEEIADAYTDGSLYLGPLTQHANLYETEINASKELTNA